MPKIEIGKKYETRDGRAVTIYSVTGSGMYPVHGTVDGQIATWTASGSCWNSKSQSPDDLIEVQPEIEGWVNIYQAPFNGG